MKRKAKQNGSGGRLRLGLLLGTVAAFLVVPGMAHAAIDSHILITGNGSGKVVGVEPTPGKPPIDCSYDGSSKSGTCDTESHKAGEGTEEEAPFKSLSVNHEAAPGSNFAGWKVVKGTPVGCTQNSPGAGSCAVILSGEIVIEAIFEKEPNVHVNIEGSGSGTIISSTEEESAELVGEPLINCHYASPGPATGVCDNVNGATLGGALPGTALQQQADEGSEFIEWIVEKGSVGLGCEPGEVNCNIFFPEPEIKVTAVFAALPTFALNLTTSGTGSGSFECDPGSGPEACQTSYLAGTEVEVIANADTGSEFVEFSGDCTGSGTCIVTMDEERSVDAQFDLVQVPFSVNQTGEGTVECEDATAGGGFGACALSYPYGHAIVVAAAPIGENVIGSLTGEGSAAGNCESEATNGSCEFSITEASGVSVSFAAGNTIVTQKENVHGEVPQTTSLATSCEGDVDLGEFIPGKAENYLGTCGLTVTSTGKAASLTATDETGNDTGHLTQKPTHPYSLPQPLEAKATGLPGLEYPGEGGGTYAPLTSPVSLLSYGGPVSADNVTLTFRQKIGLHDALHTGVYSKLITLTLKQTTP